MNLHHSLDVPPYMVGLPFTRHSLVIECLQTNPNWYPIKHNVNPIIRFLIFLVENLTPPTHERILYVQSWVL